MRRVLVVDDEENIRVVLRTLLKKHNYQVEAAESAETALEQLERFDPDFVLADVRMSGMTGLELCAELKARSSLATVILMSAYGSVDLAIEAMKVGAYDYISKPFKQDEVLIALTKAEERESLRRENRALKEAMRKEQTVHGILGKSEAIHKVFSTITKVADYKTTVLIQGESGTGKELVARALHSAVRARTNRSFRSTAVRSRRRCSRASFSATKRARSPMRMPTRRDCLRRRIKARSSSMRSASFR